jgi:hypothetical protein
MPFTLHFTLENWALGNAGKMQTQQSGLVNNPSTGCLLSPRITRKFIEQAALIADHPPKDRVKAPANKRWQG